MVQLEMSIFESLRSLIYLIDLEVDNLFSCLTISLIDEL